MYVYLVTQSCLTLWDTMDTVVAHQSPLSMGFFRQEYWSGLPCPLPGDLPDPGIKPVFLMLASVFFTTSTNWEAPKARFSSSLMV